MKSNYTVACLFADGLVGSSGNLHSDGEWLTSYRTRVARRDAKNHVIWITSTKYSVTTSAHLNLISSWIGWDSRMTDNLNNPIAGAIHHIREEAAKHMTKKPFICNLGWQLESIGWYNKELEHLYTLLGEPFVPIVPPLALLQRCAKHGVPVDFKLWALAHGKAE